MALEREFWAVLEAAAARRGESLLRLVAATDASRDDPSQPLASALRVLALGLVREG